MNLIRILFELFALYVLYKLIFDFIIPLVNTTKQVKKQFTNMNAQMQEKKNQAYNQKSTNSFSAPTTKPAEKRSNDDYIEFEEVK